MKTSHCAIYAQWGIIQGKLSYTAIGGGSSWLQNGTFCLIRPIEHHFLGMKRRNSDNSTDLKAVERNFIETSKVFFNKR